MPEHTPAKDDSVSGKTNWLAILSQPDLIRISDVDLTGTTYGCDQEWFHEHWQRQAGCGPSTAATLLYYLSRHRPGLQHLYTAASNSQEDFTRFMSEIWHYVTPGSMGVNEASILADGVVSFAADHQAQLTSAIMKIPGLRQRKDSVDRFIFFIKQGLERDCPVAFLNLSNGQLPNLDSWHWVNITGLFTEGASVRAVIADSGNRKIIDLTLWYQTSWLGGAAVYFDIGGCEAS